MHHHNKKQGLRIRKKVLFTYKTNELLARVREAMQYGENTPYPLVKKWVFFKNAAGKRTV